MMPCEFFDECGILSAKAAILLSFYHCLFSHSPCPSHLACPLPLTTDPSSLTASLTSSPFPHSLASHDPVTTVMASSFLWQEESNLSRDSFSPLILLILSRDKSSHIHRESRLQPALTPKCLLATHNDYRTHKFDSSKRESTC